MIKVKIVPREGAKGWVGMATCEDGTTVIVHAADAVACARALVDRVFEHVHRDVYVMPSTAKVHFAPRLAAKIRGES